MELEVLIVSTAIITVVILLLQSFFTFAVLAVVTFFAIQYMLESAIKSCKARKTPLALDWLSNAIDYVLKLKSVISSMIIRTDSKNVVSFKSKRPPFCKRPDSIEDEIETIVDCIVDEYIVIWLEVSAQCVKMACSSFVSELGCDTIKP